MSSREKNVLIFGPTGAVGSAAAIEAHRRGAHVWLGMRNTEKPIQGLDANAEGYTRIQADLTSPESLSKAVQQSGATAAYVYVIFQSEDAMLSSFQALKDAGVTYIVLLSSFAVKGSASSGNNHEAYIDKVHATTEMSLQKTGVPYAAVRPAFFDSNMLWYEQGIKKGEVGLIYPTVEYDFISPTDIGTISGAILTDPELQKSDAGSNHKNVTICGPKLISQQDAMAILSRALGREIKVKEITEEQWFKDREPMPRPAFETVAEGLRKAAKGDTMYPGDLFPTASERLKQYLGRESMSLEQWIKDNKALFE